MSVFDTLSSATRAALESADVHDDLGLQTLGGAQLDEWVTDPGDRVQIEFLAKRRAGLPMVALTALPMGLAHEGALEGGQRVVVARSYTNEVPWASVGEEPGPLVKGFRSCDWTPTQQRHGSCASHTTGLGLELRGYSTPCDRDVSPSRASLHLLSGEVGGHGPGEGRSYKTMQEVLFEHGHLTEKELPTGHDDFEEQQVLTRAQKRLARARVIHGAGWVVGNRDRLNFALDCVSGRVTGEPVGLQVAVEVYGSWQRCYRAGVIRRHSASEGELLGLHALLVVGFVRRHDKLWAVLANSWGPSFGALSPLGVPGLAMISVDYLAEILCHGAVVFARTPAELGAMRDAVQRNSAGSAAAEGLDQGRVAAMAPTDGALHARLLWGLVGASFLGFAAGDLAGALALSLLLVGILGPSLWGARAQLGVRTLSLARAAREGLVGRGVVGRVIGVARALLGAALVLIAWDALPPLLLFALALLLGGRGMQRQGSARAGLLGAALLLASCSILLANGLGLFTPICAVGLWLLSPALSSLSPLAERVLSLPALEGLAQRLAGAGVS